MRPECVPPGLYYIQNASFERVAIDLERILFICFSSGGVGLGLGLGFFKWEFYGWFFRKECLGLLLLFL